MNTTASAFDRLRDLTRDLTPAENLSPIQLHLGELKLPMPALDYTALANQADWGRYPPLGGTPELRAAYSAWLARRFAVQVADDGVAIEPTPGAKQAVAIALMLAVRRAQLRGVITPVLILPNPFYPTYHAAALASGAQVIFYSSEGAPLEQQIAAALASAQGRCAAVLLCNPGNPDGKVLSKQSLGQVAELARQAQARLLVDECYIDVWCDTAPCGYLELFKQAPQNQPEVLVLHTLSKRSSAPGLRSGFVAGDPETVAEYANYNRVCGVSVPYPTCAVSSLLWQDEAHLDRMRSMLRNNWALADQLLGEFASYRRPAAGFFLWLPVPDDLACTRQLWQEQALYVMPGRFLAAENADASNPGVNFLRIALVHQEAMLPALQRLREVLLQGWR